MTVNNTIEKKEWVKIPNAKSRNPIKHIRLMMKDARAFIHQKHQELGPIWENEILGQRIIYITDPEFIKHVYAKNRLNYGRTKGREDVLKLGLGNGLLTNEGESWQRQRKLIQPAFHMQNLIKLFKVMSSEVSGFLNELEEKRGIEIDFHRAFMDITGRVVYKAMFSDQPPEAVSSFYDIMVEGQRYLTKRTRNPLAKYWMALNGETKKFMQQKAYGDKTLLATVNKRKASQEKKPDLLQMLLDATYEGTENNMPERQLLDELVTIFAAGHETSSNALTWTMYLLDQHPEVLAKMKEEINAVTPDKLPGYNELKNMPYLQNVIDESMRLYPPAWITGRVAFGSDEFKGIKINKDDLILVCIYSLHHDASIYANPETFNPDRFADGMDKKWTKDFAYFPFCGGPRKCIGFMFATMEIRLILVALLQRFNFKIIPNQKIEMEAMITMQPKYGLKAILE